MRRFVDPQTNATIHTAPADCIESIQSAWAQALRTDRGPQRDALMCQLAETAEELAAVYPNDPKTQLWKGIALAGYAKVLGGLVSLKLLEQAKTALERAIALNPMDGPAHLYLGLLYENAPEAPYGFGDETAAKALLKQGLMLTLNSPDHGVNAMHK
ncbi:MAG TPA: hypothetical protein VFV57_08860 [Limnobacter sp.]|nr:hypothetical protein [Limnobacter sp.]